MDEQADLSLHWMHMSEGTFSQDVAHIVFWKYTYILNGNMPALNLLG